ncbi:unnamed protein product [Symbiodinium pilosum]|uniref:Uncharacterized protein n=1 Tax=Symbiodinium pilosum TaxID=2952 RepID=A0A812MH89_SYMPI|nr:unnamed protein product [Symbiodinium pilosum]
MNSEAALPGFPTYGLPAGGLPLGTMPLVVPPGLVNFVDPACRSHTATQASQAPAPVLPHLPHEVLQYQYMQHALTAPLQQGFQIQQAQDSLDHAQQDDEDVKETIQELQARFKLDDRITRDLAGQMKKRSATCKDDLHALWEILGGARNPAGLLRVKLREMEDGIFRGTLTPDKDVEELAKKFSLDAQAAAKLAEVLSRRDDRKRDLRQIQKHLQLSNKPSSLVMLMLKDMRNGLPIRDPEYPPSVGSMAHKRGMKGRRSRSRTRRRKESPSSSPPLRSPPRSSGAGPDPKKAASARGPRPQTLLERFG